MLLNVVVLLLNIAGACIASMAIVFLHDVACMMRTPGLRRTWHALIVIVIGCILLLLAAAAIAVRKTLEAYDLVATGIHILGPSFVLGVAWLSRRTAEEVLRIAPLEQAALVDPLTGLANRRCFDERLAAEMGRASRDGTPLSLVMLDIDHFKRVNDTLGHAAGDLVLRQIATLVAARARHLDTICRVGGEEFVAIMPGMTSDFAAASAERLRRAVAEAPIAIADGGKVHATISIGLATMRPGEDAEAFLRRADAALYASKRAGRNRVSLAAGANRAARDGASWSGSPAAPADLPALLQATPSRDGDPSGGRLQGTGSP